MKLRGTAKALLYRPRHQPVDLMDYTLEGVRARPLGRRGQGEWEAPFCGKIELKHVDSFGGAALFP